MAFNRTTAVAFCIVSVAASAALADEPRGVDISAPASIVVDLPADPIRDEAPAVASFDLQSSDEALAALARTARSNDLREFEAALASAKNVADGMPIGDARNELRRALLVYEDVDAVWSFAATDRSGAFFDDDALPGFRDRLRAYDGFESYIADYRVIDRSGNVFYASAETRSFLLAQVPGQHRAVVLTAAAVTPRHARVHHSKAAHAARTLAVAAAPVLPGTAGVPPALPRGAGETPAVPAVTRAVVRPVQAELVEPESGRGLMLIVLALIAGVLTLALRAPEDELEATTGPVAAPPLAASDEEPVKLRRRA